MTTPKETARERASTTPPAEAAFASQCERVRNRKDGEYGPYTNADWSDVVAIHGAARTLLAAYEDAARDAEYWRTHYNTQMQQAHELVAALTKRAERAEAALAGTVRDRKCAARTRGAHKRPSKRHRPPLTRL